MINDGGIGTYVRNVVPRVIRNRADWRFTVLGRGSALESLGLSGVGNVEMRHCDAPIYGAREQLELAAATPAGASLFWAPHYNVPLLTAAPLLVTIHDVCHLALPETIGTLRHAYARVMFAAVRLRARAISFDSDFSRSEMERYAGSPRGRGVVCRLGVDDDWYGAKSAHPAPPVHGPYLLYVGNMKRHKNVPALLRAFGAIRDAVPHRLILIGRRDGLRADPALDGALAEAGDRVVFAGELPRAELQRYVAHATACATASRYEGFGLPALESMAAGCPYVSTRAGSLPEICGDAALYCDADDVASISGALLRVATDARLREDLRARGVANARRFSWDRCTTETMALMEQALA